MFMHVKLLNGYPSTLTYQIPLGWPTDDLVGSLVKVPLQKRTEIALVQEVFKEFLNPVSFTIREAHARELLPNDILYQPFIRKLSSYYALDSLYFYQRVHSFLKEKEHATVSHQERSTTESPASTLTEEQQAIVSTIGPVIKEPCYYPALLHGVTGSGKTEVYKKLIIEAHQAGKSVLFLCPEVSLAVQFTALFKKQLPHFISLYSFHSATSVTEKRALWKALFSQQPLLIVGVHLPVMLPIPTLGLIIIDEEHEIGFQEKKHPKIYTKEAALLRAQLYAIPIILGSATPSLASLYKVQNKEWHFFELKKRFAGSFPTITFVKLSNKQKRKSFWISRELEQAIRDRLAKKEQIIIFLNRRGYSFFIQCKECGFIPHCLHCSVSLTLHQDSKLMCHYCNYTLISPASCSGCKAPESAFIKKGIGTQQIVTLLEKLFPEARIARADVDTTVNKKRWQETLHKFEAGAIDILVGTQTITKGYHFPRVTLVGVLWADINLSIPFYNAAETTLQQLIQVAGRAGRQTHESNVIIQALIDHPIFTYLHEIDYTQFYEYEIKHRNELSYPPCTRFVEIELKNNNETVLEREADQLAQTILNTIEHLKQAVTLLGPAQPPVHKVKNTYSRKIYLKSASIQELIKLYRSINRKLYTSSLFFTPNPLS
jgi:primosomal protein N' (replication factor Y) (superfamily II helicase)